MASATLSYTQTSVGKKVLMAVTGLFMFLFVIAHLLGNLQIFAGAEAINNYARFLRTLGGVLWGARAGLLVCLGIHMYAALTLWLQNQKARKTRYVRQQPQASTVSSRWMIATGPLILVYIVYHLLHLTLGVAHPDFRHLEPYHNLIVAFSQPISASIYVALMIALGLHLVHGVWSMFQTAGLNSNRWTGRLRLLATGVTAVIVLGNISIPLAIMAGMLN